MYKKALAAFLFISFTTVATADTCPTQFYKEYDGFWVSKQAPGWKSSEQTGSNVTINTKDFGGAVYAPTQKRLACVYRSSAGYWVAFVSHVHKGFQLDRHALDEVRKHHAWNWNNKHQDFSCGRPNVNSVKDCPFTLNS